MHTSEWLFYISTTWWVSLLVGQWVPDRTCRQVVMSSVSPACRKRRLNEAVSRNNRIKGVVPYRCLYGHVKEPYEMSMAWEPDRMSNYVFPPMHLCAVTYTTEILLIETFYNQFFLHLSRSRFYISSIILVEISMFLYNVWSMSLLKLPQSTHVLHSAYPDFLTDFTFALFPVLFLTLALWPM